MENEMLIEFIDQSESFVNGFEAGMIWVYLAENCKDFEDYPIHLENSAEIQGVCDYFNVKCEITPIDDTWAVFKTFKLTQP